MGVVLDHDVFDVGEVVQVYLELLAAEGGLAGAQVFMREVAEGFCIGQVVPSTSFCLEM